MASRKILRAIKGARAGDPAAQLELGSCYLEGGEGLAVNLSAAYRWLAAAADQGLAAAARLIGEKVPAGAVDDPRRAKAYYEAATRAGSAVAATVLARWELEGVLAPAAGAGGASAEPIGRLRRAAAEGFLPAQLELGRLAAVGRAPGEDLAWLQRAAEHGDREAAIALADYHYAAGRCDLWRAGQVPGQPAAADERSAAEAEAARAALRWHEQAWPAPGPAVPAERAYERGCLLLRQHQRAAGPWLEAAARAGHGRAAYLLGLLHLGASYLNGLDRAGVPRGRWFQRSYKRAGHWLEMAAPGLAEADMALSSLHRLPRFGQRDRARGEACLLRAAAAGHPEARFLAGQRLWRREAAAAPELEPKLQALRWWRQAADAGHAGARERLYRHSDGGREALSAGQRAAVQAMAGHSRALAARLELAALFALRLHECLLLDLRHADAGDFLRVDVSALHGKARRRLVRIETALQRDALERAKGVLLPDGRPGPEDGGGDYAARQRRFKRLCQRHRIGLAAFETPGFRDTVAKIQHFTPPAAAMIAESGPA